MASEIVHCVMGGGIVLAVYWRHDLAAMHARCVLGCEPVAVDLSSVADPLRSISVAEILDALPEEIRDDIETDWDESDEDVTPLVDEHALVHASLDVDDLDDR